MGEPDGSPLLRDYFLAQDEGIRRRLRDKVLAAEDLTVEKLSEAIRGLQLWKDQPTGDYEIMLQLGKGESAKKRVWLHVPKGYDPSQRRPLILTFHTAGGNPDRMLDYTKRLLGDRADGFLIASPNWIGCEHLEGSARPSGVRGLGFSGPHESVAQPRFLLNALRRRFHIDSDRVYLMGYSLGGSNAWTAAVMHADCFAGVVPLANTLQIVGRTVLYEEVLPNCRNTAILFCWGANDTLDGRGKPSPTGGIAGRAKTMAAVIRALDFKAFEAVEIAGAGHRDVVPPREALFELLDRRRVRFPKRVRQTFRLAQQSGAYWVAADGLRGEPRPGDRLKIPPRPGESATSAQRRYLVSRLGLIEARCKGQTLRLDSRRTRRVVLLLSDALLDLDKPVKIRKRNKTIFKGRIERDMNVLLTEAARGWDFDRLHEARVVVSGSGKVTFGYSTKKKRSRDHKKRSDEKK
ncbi:MAG: hypothetical protein ACE5EC_01380 [Phycisphaerae bacterium]